MNDPGFEWSAMRWFRQHIELYGASPDILRSLASGLRGLLYEHPHVRHLDIRWDPIRQRTVLRVECSSATEEEAAERFSGMLVWALKFSSNDFNELYVESIGGEDGRGEAGVPLRPPDPIRLMSMAAPLPDADAGSIT